MYLTEDQLEIILQTPYFTVPVTESTVQYSLYRGRFNIRLSTIRFNNTVDVRFMVQHVMNTLLSMYNLNDKLLAVVGYDLVLHSPSHNSYYLWRSNTNQVQFDVANEESIVLNFNSMYRFISKGVNIDLPSLNTNFTNSNVVVDKIVSIVFSFIKI
jgi:hypothetical protein